MLLNVHMDCEMYSCNSETVITMKNTSQKQQYAVIKHLLGAPSVQSTLPGTLPFETPHAKDRGEPAQVEDLGLLPVMACA